MITLEWFFALAGAIMAALAGWIACDSSHPRRVGSALFWAILAALFMLGKTIPPTAVGGGVVALVVLVAAKQVGRGADGDTAVNKRRAEAERLGNRLFWPVLLVPATAVVGSLLLSRIRVGDSLLFENGQAPLISLGLGSLVAVIAAQRTTGARASAPLVEGSRILESVGWVLVLPQMLAALGKVFDQAGVGHVVADLVSRALPTQYAFVSVAAYCVGMALFTMCLGNAFAAFQVVTAGIGLPLVVQGHGGDAAIMAAIGMLSGYCGTLLTPMAANFNLVPALLLDLPDKHAVIKAQLPIALTLLAFNLVLMWLCVFRF